MLLLCQDTVDEDVTNNTEDSHEQDVEVMDDFEGNLENVGEESQNRSDEDENEGWIWNRTYCYTVSRK